LSINDTILITGTTKLVDTINEILLQDGEDRCEYPLSLQKINYAMKLQNNQQLSTFSGTKEETLLPQFDTLSLKVDSYLVQVQFSTLPPGSGTFEGTFRVYQKQGAEPAIQTESHFSRVDEYGPQSCEPKPHIRQFCKCK
jgi:hypothetical protein